MILISSHICEYSLMPSIYSHGSPFSIKSKWSTISVCLTLGSRLLAMIPGPSVLDLAGLVKVKSEEWRWTQWEGRMFTQLPWRLPLSQGQNPHRNLGNLIWNICMCWEECVLVNGCWCFSSKGFLNLATAECEACLLTHTYSTVLTGPDTPITKTHSGFLHERLYLTLVQVLWASPVSWPSHRRLQLLFTGTIQ